MNSYSTLQVCMKFAYIGLVFLLSYWISDNVPFHRTCSFYNQHFFIFQDLPPLEADLEVSRSSVDWERLLEEYLQSSSGKPVRGPPSRPPSYHTVTTIEDHLLPSYNQACADSHNEKDDDGWTIIYYCCCKGPRMTIIFTRNPGVLNLWF